MKLASRPDNPRKTGFNSCPKPCVIIGASELNAIKPVILSAREKIPDLNLGVDLPGEDTYEKSPSVGQYRFYQDNSSVLNGSITPQFDEGRIVMRAL